MDPRRLSIESMLSIQTATAETTGHMSGNTGKSEEMIVRVLRDGRIVIDGSGLPPRRLRELQETLKEVLGPAQIYDETRREWPEALRLWSGASEQEEEDQKDRDRQDRLAT